MELSQEYVSNSIKSRSKLKDAGSTTCTVECDKNWIRRKVYTMYEKQRLLRLDVQLLTNHETQISCSLTNIWRILFKCALVQLIKSNYTWNPESYRLQK